MVQVPPGSTNLQWYESSLRVLKLALATYAADDYFTANGTFAHSTDGRAVLASAPQPINIGTTIRGLPAATGMSQGDIEKRTGLLRCYLSRVENGHTVPSLDTLQKIAGALEMPLSQFFCRQPVNGKPPALAERRRHPVSHADSALRSAT